MSDADRSVIGERYRVIASLGKGGMGLVYKAYDPVLDRTVALKKMIATVVDSEEGRQRFYIEARAAARLNHPNIVTIHELEEYAGDIYIVMELLDGVSLASFMRQRVDMPLAGYLTIIAQVADGLHYAHKRAIVHRDVKPPNLVLTTTGNVKILDFGIARLASNEITRKGKLLGTPHYMAPEQVKEESVDARADLFSLGAVAYELVTGIKPFAADSIPALLMQITSTPHRPVLEVAPDTEPALAAIIDRLLEKNREKRFLTGMEVVTALDLIGEIDRVDLVADAVSAMMGPSGDATIYAPIGSTPLPSGLSTPGTPSTSAAPPAPPAPPALPATPAPPAPFATSTPGTMSAADALAASKSGGTSTEDPTLSLSAPSQHAAPAASTLADTEPEIQAARSTIDTMIGVPSPFAAQPPAGAPSSSGATAPPPVPEPPPFSAVRPHVAAPPLPASVPSPPLAAPPPLATGSPSATAPPASAPVGSSPAIPVTGKTPTFDMSGTTEATSPPVPDVAAPASSVMPPPPVPAGAAPQPVAASTAKTPQASAARGFVNPGVPQPKHRSGAGAGIVVVGLLLLPAVVAAGWWTLNNFRGAVQQGTTATDTTSSSALKDADPAAQKPAESSSTATDPAKPSETPTDPANQPQEPTQTPQTVDANAATSTVMPPGADAATKPAEASQPPTETNPANASQEVEANRPAQANQPPANQPPANQLTSKPPAVPPPANQANAVTREPARDAVTDRNRETAPETVVRDARTESTRAPQTPRDEPSMPPTEPSREPSTPADTRSLDYGSLSAFRGGSRSTGSASNVYSDSPSTAAAVARITYALEAYGEAFAARDLEALRDVRSPVTPGEAALLKEGRTVVRFSNLDVSLNGNDARVRCRRALITNGKTVSSSPADVRLTRRPDGWVITEIR